MNQVKKMLVMAGWGILAHTGMQAQEVAAPYLNAYTIPVAKKGAVIAQVYDRTGHPAVSAALVEDASGLFTLEKTGILKLKKKAGIAKEGAFTYPVKIVAGADTASFTLVADAFIHNKVIAHRGAWKHHEGSQNSVTSLKDAIKLGCAGSEFDVWLSADEELVVSHDPEIGGKKVEGSTLAELQTVQLKNGDRVPTLDEFITIGMQQHATRLVLELKPSGTGRGPLLATKAVALVKARQAQAWMYYISFDYDICKKIKALDPMAKVAYLNGDKTPEVLRQDGIWGLDYHQKFFTQQPDLIKVARQQGITTNAWTIDNPAVMDTLLKEGIDFITTNEPEILLEKVKPSY
ncbi:glycerophosphodiester phosphodiesterase [Chitinophaga nivalis]|uniref:Glycerophosphodiester phosphodiesterase family protein n=1 Tax=Chitinophaga nivalis TaxID=2991709 RepID=A0ABT3IFA8_9BACT|nr:glycerophosphodiester phosphodiesterase family protein [Chitinophaga nivalis]MCW3467670.1 glycerophosphodiester phosphodiesterase family protein [Chitinophaga nivalis]MCW3482638.1 glycerophosphodiester phosphodiesterase family protein [Chitinophaga nivalis]